MIINLKKLILLQFAEANEVILLVYMNFYFKKGLILYVNNLILYAIFALMSPYDDLNLTVRL